MLYLRVGGLIRFVPFTTPRLGIHQGSHQGLTWRASTGRRTLVAKFQGRRRVLARRARESGDQPAAPLEALERERLARQQREGLAPRHTTATLLARAKVHPSIAQKILRHANIETTLAIYTHLDGIEDMRAAVAKLDFGPLAERAPARSCRCEKT